MSRCPACGEENPDHARFCLACGSALTATGVARREERKVVTVLFCDLVGFTARSDQADPEDVQARLRPYHARLRKDIERFGGTVEKFIGDAVMAVFGAPIAHEDDAERAVRSALRITQSIAEMNEEQAGLDLAVRIGVNTGEAVVALDARPEHGEGIVAGDVVNTAARLQTVAPVNGVVVGEATFRTTKDLIEYEPLEAAQLKGKAEAIPIWRAVASRSRFGVDVEQGTKSPFVGRTSELRLLIQTFTRAVEEQSLQMVTLIGEPGVGKTRLLWELRGHLDDQPDLVYWRQGRCLPYGEGVTFWALGEMLKGQAGILESDNPDEAMQKLDLALEALSIADEERDWLRSRLASLLGVGDATGTGDRGEAFAAWRRFLEAIAARSPLVLVFEDLHWADPIMLEFVEHLVDWSTGVPLLVVCSARPELYERNPSWGGGKRNSTTISLSPLSEEDTARLIAALLAQSVLPADVQAELLERAGGNPLYAEEFVRMLADRGILERHGASLRIELPAGGIPMPETVHALIEARMDTLPPDRKSLLQDASVVGKVFWSGALASMGGREEKSVRDGLHELSRKEMVRATRLSSVQEQAEYSFWHALVRDVAYGQIPRAEREQKHLAAAAWIEGLAGERLADHAEFLAHHYERALEFASAAGRPLDEETLAKAGRFIELSGDRAAPLDVHKAVGLYRRAEQVFPDADPHLPVLHAKTAEAASHLGEASSAEVADAFVAAIADLKARGEILAAGDLLSQLSRFIRAAGQRELAERLVDEAVELLEPLGTTAELASVYAVKAGSGMLSGRLQEWERYSDRALQLADELGLPDTRQRALQYRGIIRILLGDSDGGLDDLTEALRLGTELGLGQETATAYTNLADWTCRTTGAEAGLEIYRQGIAFSERRGLGSVAMWARAESTWPLFDLGRWDAVLAQAQTIREWFGDGGVEQPLVIGATQEAHVRLWRGEIERAADLIAYILPVAREIGDIQVIRPALTGAARLEATRSRPAEARELLGELEADLGRIEHIRNYGMMDGVLVALSIGDIERAERIAKGPNVGFAFGQLSMLTSQALIAEATGSHRDALTLLEQAAEGWSEMGHVFDVALTQLAAARCLAELERFSEAAERATLAERTFDSVRAVSLSAEARGQAERAHAVGS